MSRLSWETFKTRSKALMGNPIERRFAKALRKAKIRFKRNWIIGPYIVDIFIADKNLIIEIDGKDHDSKFEYDSKREGFLRDKGFEVMRVTNQMVLNKLDDCLQMLYCYGSSDEARERATNAIRECNQRFAKKVVFCAHNKDKNWCVVCRYGKKY